MHLHAEPLALARLERMAGKVAGAKRLRPLAPGLRHGIVLLRAARRSGAGPSLRPDDGNLADHFLLRLYELAEHNGYSMMHSLDKLAAEVGVSDRGKVLNVAKALEERGLILASLAHDGSSASLTGEGALSVEAVGKLPSQTSAHLLADAVDGPSGRWNVVDAWESLLHPAIQDSALIQYHDGHWRDAVLNACIAVFEIIRERTGLELDGEALVTRAFSADRPLLVVADLAGESGRNDQIGFMMILQGVYRGIRSPKAHSLRHDLDALKAAQYLVMASLLARRIDEAETRENGGAA